MLQQPNGDEYVMLRIEGMHCHRCEQAIQRALKANPGVSEAEVDFASGQASVLYDPAQVKVRQLVDAVTQAGYRVSGFSQRQPAGERGEGDKVRG